MRKPVLWVVFLFLSGCGAASTGAENATTTSTAAVPTPQQWSHAPSMAINRNGHYTATVKTSDGMFTIALLPRIAPIAVNSFVFLSRHHFYNHVTFHRIIQNMVIQTGDPTGTGYGGPGYSFKDEPVTMKYRPGVVAMANSGPNTNGSQFFIVTGSGAASLQPKYTIFGKVVSGMKVVNEIAATPVTVNAMGELSQPLTDVYINSITIHS